MTTCSICYGTPCVLEGTPIGSFISGAHIPRREATLLEIEAASRARADVAQRASNEREERAQLQEQKQQSKAARRAAWEAAGGKRRGDNIALLEEKYAINAAVRLMHPPKDIDGK